MPPWGPGPAGGPAGPPGADGRGTLIRGAGGMAEPCTFGAGGMAEPGTFGAGGIAEPCTLWAGGIAEPCVGGIPGDGFVIG